MAELKTLIEDVADACKEIDSSEPAFKAFQRGVGPYGEPQLVKLIASRLNALPAYAGRARSKRTPDLLVERDWALEFKIARPYGDNGNEAENWSCNLLHPYPGNVSVFGDCLKLSQLPGPERRAVVVLGFEHEPPRVSLEVAFCAFEAIARAILPFDISARSETKRSDLVHPVHQALRVAAWEVPQIAPPADG
jgi:hypothetical protein